MSSLGKNKTGLNKIFISPRPTFSLSNNISFYDVYCNADLIVFNSTFCLDGVQYLFVIRLSESRMTISRLFILKHSCERKTKS